MPFSDPVVVLVLAVQVAIFWRCSVLARGDESEELDRLWKTFQQDIHGRAKRGDGPDWVRYMDEADRVHERRVDRMRIWATAALVVGIGGTMAALSYRLWGLSTFELGVLTAFAPALLASLSGVATWTVPQTRRRECPGLRDRPFTVERSPRRAKPSR